MSHKKLKAKRTIPEKIEDNDNVRSYLAQYKLTDIANPSDDSDFEDTSYETDMLYEKEKKLRETTEAKNKIQIDEQRQKNAKKYFQKNIESPNSIFNLQGINFKQYDHKIIKFTFTPSEFNREFICAHRKFHVTLIYKRFRWSLKRFHVPNKDKILKIFYRRCITDEDLSYAIFKIHKSLVKWTYEQVISRKDKYEKFLQNKEIELNSDDERLFLSPETQRRRREHVEKIWNRMLPP